MSNIKPVASVQDHGFDASLEQRILTGLIVSTPYLREIQDKVLVSNFEFFKNEYIRTIVKWVVQYYKTYQEAPGQTIQSIFEAERSELNSAEASLIETALVRISQEYESQETFNLEYLLDQTIKYFTERSLVLLADKVKGYTKVGDMERALQLVQGYRKVAKTISSWVSPFEKEVIRRVHDARYMGAEEGSDFLFRFPGALGKYLGVFERGWLVAIQGPEKRGKSWWLQEFVFQAILNNLNAALVNLEMGETGALSRVYKRLTSHEFLQTQDAGDYIIPVFDCRLNQTGACTKDKRSCGVRLLNAENEKPMSFSTAPDLYKPCTACRGTKDFQVGTWFEILQKQNVLWRKLNKQLRSFGTVWGKHFRFKRYPTYSASVSSISADIATLEYTDEFAPDVIVIDYADILAPEDRRGDVRERIDDTWKTLKRLATERHCLVVVGSQSSRRTLEARNVRAVDTSEDIRKLAHVDLMISLNQMAEEKRQGVMRIGINAHRWQEFDEAKQVMVLQQLKLGQPNLDSEIPYGLSHNQI